MVLVMALASMWAGCAAPSASPRAGGWPTGSVREKAGANAKIAARRSVPAQQFRQVDAADPTAPSFDIEHDVISGAGIGAALLVEVRCGLLRHRGGCLFGGGFGRVVLARLLVGRAVIFDAGRKFVDDVSHVRYSFGLSSLLRWVYYNTTNLRCNTLDEKNRPKAACCTMPTLGR